MKRIAKSGFLFLIYIPIIIFALSCGCSSRREGKTFVIPYEVTRKEWLNGAGTHNIPKEVMGRSIDFIKVDKRTVWLGLRDYGIAQYSMGKRKWRLMPIKWPKEIVVLGIEKVANNLYVGTSGPGLWKYDLGNPGAGWKLLDNPLGIQSNEVNSIALINNSVWTTTFDGLYKYDIRRGEFTREKKGKIFGSCRFGNEYWAAEHFQDGKLSLLLYDASTGKKKGKWETISYRSAQFINSTADYVIIGSDKGFLVFDKRAQKYKDMLAPEKFPNFTIWTVAMHDGGYLGATDGGLVYFNPSDNEWLLINAADGLPKGRIISVGSVEGTIFLGMEKGAFVMDSKLWGQMKTLARKEDSLGVGDENGMVADGGGKIVAGHGDLQNWVHLTIDNGMVNNRVNAILPVGDEIWLATALTALSRISLKDMRIKNYLFPKDVKRGVPQTASVQELAQDGDLIWHGGYAYYGAFSRSKEKWMKGPYPIKGDINKDVEALWTGSKQVWVGMRKQGIRVLDKKSGKWTDYPGDYFTLSPLMTDIVYAEGAFWISSDTGLRRFSEENGRFITVPIDAMDIETMVADGDILWMGSREKSEFPGPKNTGIFKLNLTTHHFVKFNEVPGACGRYVNKVFSDGPYIWIAARERLSRYNRLSGEWTSYSAADGLEAGDVLSVAVSADNLLVGTDNGLYIKPTFEFDDPGDKTLYRRAWQFEKDGDFSKAVGLYEELIKHIPGAKGDKIRYRMARCMEKAGNSATALIVYEKLLEKHPLLLLDLESVFATRYGFDVYLDRVGSLMKTFKPKSREWFLCRAFTENLDMPLKHYALKFEDDKDYEKAARFWRRLLSKTENEEVKKQAKRHLNSLEQKNRISQAK